MIQIQVLLKLMSYEIEGNPNTNGKKQAQSKKPIHHNEIYLTNIIKYIAQTHKAIATYIPKYTGRQLQLYVAIDLMRK